MLVILYKVYQNVIISYPKHPINGNVKHILMMKKALGIVSNVLLYTTLYTGRIAPFDKFSSIILTEFMDPADVGNKHKLLKLLLLFHF